MKWISLLILVVAVKASFAQCGREHPSGFYIHSKSVTSKGDTVNKVDDGGLYHGLYYYTDNAQGNVTDTTSYVMGTFVHGLPVGMWTDRCRDGSYSTGSFNCIGQLCPDSSGVFVKKMQGIYAKVGVWKYYDSKGVITEVKRYDRRKFRHGWCDRTYVADSRGKFILVEFKSKYHYSDEKKRLETTRIYTSNGLPVSKDYNTPKISIQLLYNKAGKIDSVIKEKKVKGKIIRNPIESDSGPAADGVF